jgi:hypothetical protein
LKEDATLKDMASILNEDVWFRRNRSRVYLYLVPIVSIFYFVPAIQVKLKTSKYRRGNECFSPIGFNFSYYINLLFEDYLRATYDAPLNT